MNAAKVMGYPRLTSFWQFEHVLGDRFSREQLLKVEVQFRKYLQEHVDIEPSTLERFNCIWS